MRLGQIISQLLLACLPLLLVAQASPPPDMAMKAAAGNADAQFALAEVLFGERVAVPDVAGALQWYRRAAEGGNPEAHAKLAAIYWYGHKVPQDRAISRRWRLSAANLGHVPSMLVLAQDYDLGVGVERDAAESARWAKRAADAGDAPVSYTHLTLPTNREV